MGRYDTAVRCAQVRNLVEQHQYLKAMEEIEDLDFESIPSISDLYLFADVFLKAEKMDMAKKLYYIVYNRTASRPALYRLLMLVIEMGDVEEARELYLTYEVVAGVTLDTYVLHYRLAKAEGAPRTKLIDILEHLKRDEYTEEWGFQLAKLYEMEGLREKCIQECDRIVCWFGTGKIVEKAKELKQRCMSPAWTKPLVDRIPEPEKVDPEETVSFAYAPVHVEDIISAQPREKEKELSYAPAREEENVAVAEQEKTDDRKEETLSYAPAREEEGVAPARQPLVASEPLPDEGIVEHSAASREEAGEEEDSEHKSGFLKRLVNYFKIDLDMFEEDAVLEESLDVEEQKPGADSSSAHGREAAGGNGHRAANPDLQVEYREKLNLGNTASGFPVESLEEKLREINEHQNEVRPLEVDAGTQAAVTRETIVPVDKAAANRVMQPASQARETKSHPLGISSLTEDIVEQVSKNGIHYNTLKGTIYKIHQQDGVMNFALTGGASGIALAVAKKLSKELKKIGYFEAKNIGKISSDKLDAVNLDEWAEKFIGGCMYITEAPSLSSHSVQDLSNLIRKYQKQIVIILEGSYDEMDSFLNYHKEFEALITYKVRL